ncbi:MAG: RES domain-containing protein, partial [Pseudomonadota bacterium]
AAATPADGPSRAEGDRWLEAGRTAFLKVPSALVPQSWNWLLNPRHEASTGARIAATEPLAFDPRFA